MNTKDFNSKCT